jgi:BirA family biotin operon repressor/biotin-[acetyl-CoA-carboxylase] ligase|tara:strand:+ start:409 stop:1212 length:804 start_codon:yes stop_codon:yes gene_type:complete
MKENNPNLSKESILKSLSKIYKEKIDSIFIEDSTESTNDNAKDYLENQRELFSVHLAEQQTSGRGRNKRKWISPHGKNIYLSFAWKASINHSQLEGLSLAVATSLRSALKEFTSEDLKIKWPNDLLINKKKISGILIETNNSKEGLNIVIGIGINVHMNELDGLEIDQSWGNLEDNHANRLDRNEIIASIIYKMHDLFKEYPKTGFRSYQDDFEAHNLLKEKLCKVEMEKETLEGKVLGVNEIGELIFEKNGEIQHLRYGEVSIREL